MDDESGDDEKDGLTGESLTGESRQKNGEADEMNLELTPKTR